MRAWDASRRALIVLPGLLWGEQQLGAQVAALPPSRDLGSELASAVQRRQPLLVLVSLHACVYCERVRRSYLLPMLAQGQAVVQIDMHSQIGVRDFQSVATVHEEVVRRWRVQLAPTVLFFGPGGREVAERMEGTYQPDFYAAYLEDRLKQARQRL